MNTTHALQADKWSVKCYCLFTDCLSVWWTIISASRGSPRFPVVSVFLFVIHLRKRWKAERVTVMAITRLLLCPFKIVLLLHSLSKLRVALEWAWEGEPPLQPEHDGAGPEPQSCLRTPPLQIAASQQQYFSNEHTGSGRRSWIPQGASRAAEGWEQPVVLLGRGCIYAHVRRLLDRVGFKGVTSFFGFLRGGLRKPQGVRLRPSSHPSCSGRLRLWKKVKFWACSTFSILAQLMANSMGKLVWAAKNK